MIVWDRDGTAFVAGEGAAAPDHGLLYGQGLFETVRVAAGRPLFLEQHLTRLYRSAPVVGIEELPPYERLLGALDAATAAAVERSGDADGALRLTATRGPGEARPWGAAGPARLHLSFRPGQPYPDAAYRAGFTAIVATSTCRNERSPLACVKSCNYLDSLLARREALAAGADEALLLNTAGRLAEGACSNLFLVEGGRLITPPCREGALPGIVREWLLATARREGWPVAEEELAVDRLHAAAEAFLTSALLGVMPLTRWTAPGTRSARPLGNGRPGPVTRRIAAALHRTTVGEARRGTGRREG